MRVVILIAVLLLLNGCASGIPPKIKVLNTLMPGVVQIKKSGEPMLETGLIKSVPGFMARANSYLSDMDGVVFPLVKKGTTWQCFSRIDNGDLLCSNEEYFSNEELPTSTNQSALDKPSFVIRPWGEFRGFFYKSTGRISEQPGKLKGVFVPVEVPMPETYKHELIYDGRVEDNIKITYLEFAEDFTRPTFFQGLSFNIASLNIINVKNIMIEVLEANSQQIRFIVKN